MGFPLWLLGCLISMGGSVGAIVGTTIQKISFRKNDALPLSQRRVYWRQGLWLAGLALVGVGGVTDFVSLGMAPQSTIAALGSLPLAANVLLAHFWLSERVTKLDLLGTALIVIGSTLSVVFGDHDDRKYTSHELQDLYKQLSFIVFGAGLLVSGFVMYALCRVKLTPLRVALVEAIDAYNVAEVEQDMERAVEEQVEDWAACEADAAAAAAASSSSKSPPSLLLSYDTLAAEEDERKQQQQQQQQQQQPASVTLAPEAGCTLPAAMDVSHAVEETLLSPSHRRPAAFSSADGDGAVVSVDLGLTLPSDESLETLRERVQCLEGQYLPWIRLHPVFYCALSGMFGAQSLLFGKSVATLLASSMDGNNQFTSPLTWVFLLALGGCLVGQLHFFAMGLEYFDALFIVPVFKCFFLTLSTLGGALYFDEFDAFNTTQWVVFPLGLAINLTGVWVLSTRNMSVQGSAAAAAASKGAQVDGGASTGYGAMANTTVPSASPLHVASSLNDDVLTRVMLNDESIFDDGSDLVGALNFPDFKSKIGAEREQQGGGAAKRSSSRKRSARDGSASPLEPVALVDTPHAHTRSTSATSTSSFEDAVAERMRIMQARALAEASENLMRSAVEIANEARGHEQQLTRSNSQASMASGGLASHLLESDHHAAHHYPRSEHERVLLVTSPIAGAVLVASEMPGGGGGGERQAGLYSPRSPARSVGQSMLYSPLGAPRRTTSGQSAIVAHHPVGSYHSVGHHHPFSDLAIDVSQGPHGANGVPAHLYPTSSGSTDGGHSMYSAQPSPSVYATSVLADGAAMMGVNVFSLPASSPIAMRTQAAAAGGALAQTALRRGNSHPEQESAETRGGRAHAVGSMPAAPSRFSQQHASHSTFDPHPSSGSSTPTGGAPRAATRRGSQGRLLPPTPSKRRPLVQPDILVQRGNLIYRQPWHSNHTPLDSSRGVAAGEASTNEHGLRTHLLPAASNSGSVSSNGAGWDAVPLYLTPAQSSPFTVASPLTQHTYSMPREHSIFPHTRQYMARLGSATNLSRHGGVSPAASVGSNSSGQLSRARSVASPHYQAPPVRGGSGAGPSASGTSAPYSGSMSSAGDMFTAHAHGSDDDDHVWRQAHQDMTHSSAGDSHAALTGAAPYVPAAFLFQPLGQLPQTAAARSTASPSDAARHSESK